MINRIYYSCSCIIEFIKLVAKKAIKCSVSLTFYSFSSTCLCNSIKHEHSYKILYVSHSVNTSSLDKKKFCLYNSVTHMLVYKGGSLELFAAIVLVYGFPVINGLNKGNRRNNLI